MIALANPLAYLAAIAVAEVITVFLGPSWGLAVYLFLLVVLIVNSTVMRTYPIHRFHMALGLVPLIRIVSLSMPLSEVPLVYWYLIMAVPLVLGVLAVASVLKMKPSDLGIIVGKVGLQILAALSGVVIGLVDYVILKPEPLVEVLTLRSVVVPALVLLVGTGLVEELAFRGVIQRAAETVGAWGWIYVAVISSVLQIGHHSILHWVLALGMALLYGWIVKRTGSIVGVSLSHGIVNICLYLLFPFVF
jgi:membrane protease YdiL (CAAX protease family)